MTRAGAKRARLFRENNDQDSKLKRGKRQKYYSNVRGDTVVQDGQNYSEKEKWRHYESLDMLPNGDEAERGIDYRNLFGTMTEGARAKLYADSDDDE